MISLKRLWKRLARAVAVQPTPLGLDQHVKGGVYENYGRSTYEGTIPVVDYDKVSLMVVKGYYVAVDHDMSLVMACVQAKTAINPGDPIVVYQGSDDRFWIRARDEYNQKFKELERYP